MSFILAAAFILAIPRLLFSLFLGFLCVFRLLELLRGRGEYHAHVAPLEPGRGLDSGRVLQLFRDPLEHPHAEIGMGYLAALKYYGDLDLVPFAQEPSYVPDLELKIMLLGLSAELDLLDAYDGLLFLGLFGLLAHLVLLFAIVHYAADRRVRCRRDFDEIQSAVLGSRQSILGSHHAELIAFIVNDPDLWNPYHLVDSCGVLCYKNSPPPGRLLKSLFEQPE